MDWEKLPDSRANRYHADRLVEIARQIGIQPVEFKRLEIMGEQYDQSAGFLARACGNPGSFKPWTDFYIDEFLRAAEADELSGD